jgi:hypothetical protein
MTGGRLAMAETPWATNTADRRDRVHVRIPSLDCGALANGGGKSLS